jgi:hypothetical protein
MHVVSTRLVPKCVTFVNNDAIHMHVRPPWCHKFTYTLAWSPGHQIAIRSYSDIRRLRFPQILAGNLETREVARRVA